MLLLCRLRVTLISLTHILTGRFGSFNAAFSYKASVLVSLLDSISRLILKIRVSLSIELSCIDLSRWRNTLSRSNAPSLRRQGGFREIFSLVLRYVVGLKHFHMVLFVAIISIV